ncbi:hypothetical protein C7446_0725 [Kushneria sinocarnis]|uniref:Uncharacterized protein n=1 Tax=Kushneria sinocarnis TaxID=595502 RepID=A0A420WZM9_9GAMM|nr:hypothetical protein C7446_0725 [Kushneria sinocarnis]
MTQPGTDARARMPHPYGGEHGSAAGGRRFLPKKPSDDARHPGMAEDLAVSFRDVGFGSPGTHGDR